MGKGERDAVVTATVCHQSVLADTRKSILILKHG